MTDERYKKIMDDVKMPEPAAHMYPSDLKRLKDSETWAHAYSVAVGNPGERSVPLFTLADMESYASDRADKAAEEAVLKLRG